MSWVGFTDEQLAKRFRVPAVAGHQTVGSTNDVARELIAAGCPAGTVVVAETQTAGRGRGGKSWESPPGLGLWMSIVLRPADLPHPGLLPILVGLALAEALDPLVAPAMPMVKWPNDVLMDGRKICGILCESVLSPNGGAAVVVGVGVNVGHGPRDFPPDLDGSATSVRIVSGCAPPLDAVAAAIVPAVLRRAAAPPAQLSGAVLEALSRRDALAGHLVRVEGAEAVEGLALGINAGGALLIRSGGTLRTIHAGTVRIVAPGSAE